MTIDRNLLQVDASLRYTLQERQAIMGCLRKAEPTLAHTTHTPQSLGPSWNRVSEGDAGATWQHVGPSRGLGKISVFS